MAYCLPAQKNMKVMKAIRLFYLVLSFFAEDKEVSVEGLGETHPWAKLHRCDWHN